MSLFNFHLIPREERFFILFDQSAHNTVKIATQFRDLLNLWENVKERIGIINEFEHQGDAITHQIMALLNSVFLTPFDREDIVSLAQSLDDITDLIHATAETMLIYNMEQPDVMARQMAEIIVQTVEKIEKAVSDIHTRIDPQKINKCCIEVNTLETTGSNLYRSLMSDLFENNTNITNIIKLREVYRYMRSILLKCVDVTDVLEGIAIKFA